MDLSSFSTRINVLIKLFLGYEYVITKKCSSNSTEKFFKLLMFACIKYIILYNFNLVIEI